MPRKTKSPAPEQPSVLFNLSQEVFHLKGPITSRHSRHADHPFDPGRAVNPCCRAAGRRRRRVDGLVRINNHVLHREGRSCHFGAGGQRSPVVACFGRDCFHRENRR